MSNIELSNKPPTKAVQEKGFNFDDSNLWEMLKFSPPLPTDVMLRCCALAEVIFFSELLIQLTDKLTTAEEHTKDEFHYRVINKCLTQLDIMKIKQTRN